MRVTLPLLTACALLIATFDAAHAADAKDDQKSDAEGESSRDERMGERQRRLGDRIKSVQRKAFVKRGRHELNVNGALSLNDAFYQQFAVGAAYAYHAMDWLAIELDVRYYVPPIPTNTYTILRTTTPTQGVLIYSPQLSLSGEVQFAPVYGKISVFAETVIHFDVYIAAGVGFMMTEDRRPGDGSPFRILGSGAIGLRVMLTPWLTVRAEVRDQFYPDTRTAAAARPGETAIQNLLLFNLGVSVFLPPSIDYKNE